MEQNIYTAMYVPFTIYKYHGMTNFTIIKKNDSCKHLISRKIDVVLQAGIIICFIVWLFYWIIISRVFVINEKDVLVKLFSNTIVVFTTIGIIVFLITGLVRNQRLPIIFQQINQFDTTLSQALQTKLFYKNYSKKLLVFRLLLWLAEILADILSLLNNLSEPYTQSAVAETLTYHLFFSLITVSSTLYCCFIVECQRRVNFANDYIKKMVFQNRFIACIETKLTPVVNAGYRLEDLKTELCALIDIIDYINRCFEVQLFVKVANVFISVLWPSYYFIDELGEEFDWLLALKTNVSFVVWVVVSILDFCIDVHIFQRLLAEVRKTFVRLRLVQNAATERG